MTVRFNPSIGMWTDINSVDQDGKPVDPVATSTPPTDPAAGAPVADSAPISTVVDMTLPLAP